MARGDKKPKHRGKPSGKKRAKNVVKPKAKKQLADREPKSFDRTHVQWSFRCFDNYDWSEENHKTVPFTEIAGQMRSYESMTWGQIRGRPKHDHPIQRYRIITEAQNRLRELGLDDYDELWRFRFGGKLRLWGLRMGSVFHVLWWDPQHRVYPSPKKYT